MALDLVVGIGGGGSGYEAARTAARVAGMLDGGSIVLVFGYEASVPGPRGGALEDQIAGVGAVSTSAIHEELTAAYPQLRIDVELVHDRPVESLIRVAQARGADAIVVGHGDRGPMAGALLGSITYEIVHCSPIPVLVVPSDD